MTCVRIRAEEHVDRVSVELHNRGKFELAAVLRARRHRDIEHGLHVLGGGADQPVRRVGNGVRPLLATARETVGRADASGGQHGVLRAAPRVGLGLVALRPGRVGHEAAERRHQTRWWWAMVAGRLPVGARLHQISPIKPDSVRTECSSAEGTGSHLYPVGEKPRVTWLDTDPVAGPMASWPSAPRYRASRRRPSRTACDRRSRRSRG